MPADCRRRRACRLCESERLELVVPFTPTPIADAYVPRERLHEKQPCYPLDLHFCHACGHVQLIDVVDPEVLFRSYTYQSSSSAGLVKHFVEYADSVLRRLAASPQGLAVEIGSNDGTMLRAFQARGWRVLGVDPAREIARRATEAGVETWPEFMTPALARRIRQERGPAMVVAANNVFAHADDMAGMVDAVRELLAPEGLFVFEASYVVDVVDRMLLGTIFHEHLCYHAVGPLRSFLARHGLELIDVERVFIQGGSIIGFAQKAGGPRKPSAEVERLVAEERQRGFDRAETYKAFSTRVNTLRDQVRELLQGLKSRGSPLAGFGAARGGTTLIYHFGLGDFLTYIVDDSPEKHHLFSPGVHIPVLPGEEIYEKKPSHLFLLAWVHAKPILARHKKYLEQGGHFIIAHPELEVV